MGQARSRNEDSLSLLPELGVAVVADGMGGHPGGDVASRIAAETATKVLQQELGAGAGAAAGGPGSSADERSSGSESATHPGGAKGAAGASSGAGPSTVPGATGAGPAADPSDRLRKVMLRSVLSAHEAIREEGQREPDLEGMGTTITAMAVDPVSDAFVLGHVGDSRAYLFRDGRLTQLTKDDTWVQERIDAQQLTAEQARRHPFAHLLTQCLGLEDTPVPHITHGSVQVGDVYLLCTDGLVGMLEDAALEEILSREIGANGASPDAAQRQPAVQALVDAANEAGGYDNITAVLVTIAPA